jgi:hypothetical protein
VSSTLPVLVAEEAVARFDRCILKGSFDPNAECIIPTYDGSDSIVTGGFPNPGGTNILDVDPLFVAGPLHDQYLSQFACGDAVDSPAFDAGPALASDVGMGPPYSSCKQGMPDVAAVDWGFHASGLGYGMYPDGVLGTPLRVLRGTRPNALTEIAVTDSLPWVDAPGVLSDPTMPLLFYSVETVLTVVRAVPDTATDSVRLTR